MWNKYRRKRKTKKEKKFMRKKKTKINWKNCQISRRIFQRMDCPSILNHIYILQLNEKWRERERETTVGGVKYVCEKWNIIMFSDKYRPNQKCIDQRCYRKLISNWSILFLFESVSFISRIQFLRFVVLPSFFTEEKKKDIF